MNAVELSLQALAQCDALFKHEHMWEKVREAMRPMVERSNDSRDALVVDDVSAAQFVISVVARYIEQQIEPGKFHVYRGTLGIHGQSLRNIAETALRRLEEIKAISRDSYLSRLGQLDQTVMEADAELRSSGLRWPALVEAGDARAVH
jgi:hypothetical protein